MDPQALIIALTLCWIIWMIFSTLRRYLMARSQAALQEKIFARIDSTQALIDFAANDSGRRFLESLTLEKTEPVSPYARILNGIQVGIVLTAFGFALLYLHHVLGGDNPGPGLLILGAGAVGLGIGFLIAAAVSLWLSRSLGLLDRDRRG